MCFAEEYVLKTWLSKHLSEKTVEKALLQNNVEEEEDDDDGEDTDDEAEDIIAAPGANDAQVLPDNRQTEYNRLENMMARVKSDITRRKGLVENLLKEDQELLTEAEGMKGDAHGRQVQIFIRALEHS